jgi:hypothetical protein
LPSLSEKIAVSDTIFFSAMTPIMQQEREE